MYIVYIILMLSAMIAFCYFKLYKTEYFVSILTPMTYDRFKKYNINSSIKLNNEKNNIKYNDDYTTLEYSPTSYYLKYNNNSGIIYSD